MIRSFTLWTFLLTLLISPAAYAQLSCEYTILMDDTFGDGWNLATVIVTVDGNANTYTLNTGTTGVETFTVTDGDDISIEFTSGIFDYEITYTILDADGVVFFEDGANVTGLAPFIGVAFEGTAGCPSCPAPPASSVDVENIRAFTADISWVPSDPIGEYVIEYGENGFMQGDGDLKTVTGGGTTLFNLDEKTPYQFYLTTFCANGDTSITIGPYGFETLYAVDVGVSEILSPQTGCGLGLDTLSLVISNYGGLPQSLIPFNYSINGIPGSVGMPQDGFYTGVVGTDSMEVTEFDNLLDFSEPGEYFIQVWTEVEGDSVIANDTTSLLVISIPVVEEYPYFDDLEPWGGGWTVESNGFNAASWEYGTPSGNIINSAASGENAWVTNLSGNYNDEELSYLISPCFDFSSFNEDPRVAFNLNIDLGNFTDEAWFEYTIDEGETWVKMLEGSNAVNWYNNTDVSWIGNGGFEGWSYVQNIATDLGGESDVRFRFVFSSDFFEGREGIGLDNVYVGEVADIDFASTGLSNTSTEVCGSVDDGVALTITNVGNDPQAVFDVSYSVNGGPVITESVEQPLLPGASFTYTFMAGFDSSIPGVYEIQAWVTLPNDGLLLNDAINFVYRTAFEAPFREDFEGGAIPFGWNVDPSVQVSNGHNNATQAIHANVWSSNPSVFMSGPVVGPIELGDTLTFDYRYVDYFDGTIATVLGPGDSLIVELSDDCGVTYTELFNITEDNHTSSTEMTTIELALPVENNMNPYYSVRFRGVWANGDYWLDIDNINVRRCPESLLLDAEIIGASSQNSADGMVTIIPGAGEGPYSYKWSTGDNTKVVSDLTPGTYQVTVTDVYGCEDVLDIVVDVMSSINEPLSNIEQLNIAPNPTTGRSSLNVRFRQPMDAHIQIFNPIGQLVFSQAEQHVQERTYELDLSQQNSGMYLVRIIAEGEIKTAKLVKVR